MTAVASDEKLITADEFWALPESRRPMELICGRIEYRNVPGSRHGQLCGRADRILGNFVTEHDPDTVRGTDVCFYSYARPPKGPLPAKYVGVVPELVIEVRSPDDRWKRILRKVAEYLEAGVTIVCGLDPKTESAHVYSADDEQTLKADDTLTFPEVLPGFSVPVRRFFE